MSSGHFLQSIIDRPRRERLHEYRKLGPASGRRSDGACPRKGRSLISVATEKVCTIQIKARIWRLKLQKLNPALRNIMSTSVKVWTSATRSVGRISKTFYIINAAIPNKVRHATSPAFRLEQPTIISHKPKMIIFK